MKRLLLVFAFTLMGAAPAMATEEPKFALISKQGDFEIRDYEPTVTAEVDVQGGAERARNSGFNPLADYIFAKDRKGGKIAMTAPVTQVPRQTIAMTAPVTQAQTASGWTVAFTMPAAYSLDKLPAPANPAVTLHEQPARRMAVVRFSGTASASEMDKKRQQLIARVTAEQLHPLGVPTFAFYDPPWTLPFLRRNEVMVEVQR